MTLDELTAELASVADGLELTAPTTAGLLRRAADELLSAARERDRLREENARLRQWSDHVIALVHDSGEVTVTECGSGEWALLLAMLSAPVPPATNVAVEEADDVNARSGEAANANTE